MTWTLEKEFRFEASHQLPEHDGKCSRLHGHSWRGRLVCQGDRLQESGPKEGMLVDFSEMGALIKPIVEEKLDHWHLNESLGMRSPTSEAIAKWIFDQVKPKLPSLVAVMIEETCTSKCWYQPEASKKIISQGEGLS
jgi:6-pyruvoyltetrahydropterin/6-carboxytetrahydropterin synthase